MRLPRVLIAEDHPEIAERLVDLLGNRFDVVGTISGGTAVVEAVLKLEPDLILLDISLPHVNGLVLAREIKQRRPDFKIIVLTMHSDPGLAAAALERGASGYVLKDAIGQELLTAVDTVLKGGTYLARALSG